MPGGPDTSREYYGEISEMILVEMTYTVVLLIRDQVISITLGVVL